MALPIVGSKLVAWPPEPFPCGVIEMIGRSMQRAQRDVERALRGRGEE